MNQPVGKQAFDQAEKLFRETFNPGHVLALAEKTVTTSKEFYEKAAAAAHDGAKALTEIADAAWGSTKLLNEKLAQNMTANVAAAFAAAQQIAAAQSLPEIVSHSGMHRETATKKSSKIPFASTSAAR